MPLHLIKTPSEIDLAWAEHAERQRILDAYADARTQAEATAARWEAFEYDLANPGTSPLLDELDGLNEYAAVA